MAIKNFNEWLTLKESIITELQKRGVEFLEVPKAYFTHISHQLGLQAEVTAGLPEGVSLAYDGLTISL